MSEILYFESKQGCMILTNLTLYFLKCVPIINNFNAFVLSAKADDQDIKQDAVFHLSEPTVLYKLLCSNEADTCQVMLSVQ